MSRSDRGAPGDARAAGCDLAVLQAVAEAAGLYRRLALVPFGEITEYKPRSVLEPGSDPRASGGRSPMDQPDQKPPAEWRLVFQDPPPEPITSG